MKQGGVSVGREKPQYDNPSFENYTKLKTVSQVILSTS